MRLLMISWEYPPYVVGGMGKHVAELVPALSGCNAEGEPLFIDVLTTHLGGGDAVEQVDEYTTVHRVATFPLDPHDPYNSVVEANQPLVEYARTLAAKQRYDIIHAHDWLVADAAIALKLEWRTPLIVTIHATERGRHQGNLPDQDSHLIDRLEWKSCFEAWSVIVCSDYMASEVHEFFGAPMGKILIIPNGVNISLIQRFDAATLAEVRQHYTSNDEHLLFFVGRIVYEKGLQVLLRAMPEILAQHPNTRLLVAGKNSRERLPLARDLGIAEQVDFLGFISDEHRDQLLQTVDAAIFPSLYEPFGIVALEAMANSCNVIASDVGGLSDVVRHELTGLTVFPNDPASIAWAVNKLFITPWDAKYRRQRALREVQTRYNWETIAASTINLYEQVAAERREVDW